MAKPKKPKFSKLDQRIYNSIGPYFYSTNKESAKIAVKNILKNKSYWEEGGVDHFRNYEESGRQTQDPYFNEMFQYALGKGDIKDLEYFEESPYKPSISKEDAAKYIRLKDLDKKAFLEKHQSFLRDNETNKLPIVSSELQTINPEGNPDYTFGNLTAGKGEDEKGKYISVYDKWDFANKQANRFLDRKPEMYDKIYYNDKYEYLDQTQHNNKMASNNLKEYGAGGVLAQAGMGVLGGMSGGPGGMLLGGAFGLAQGLIGNNQQKQQEEALALQEQEYADTLATNQYNNARSAYNAQGSLDTQYQPTFATGGVIPEIPVELENDEVFKKPGESKIYEVDGKYHTQGGESYKLPVGTEVLGKNTNPLTGNTFKKDGMKLKKAQDRILSRESKPGTIGKESDNKNLKRIINEYNGLFLAQEKMKKGGKIGKMKDGGRVEMPWGGLAGFNNVGQSLLGGGDNTGISLSGLGLGGVYAPQSSDAYNNKTGFGDWWDYSAKPTMGNLGQGIKGAWQNAGGLGGVLNQGAQLAGVGYNLLQGIQPAEHLNASDYYNPFGNQAMDLMANRRFDIDPMLESNRNASAIGQYNLKNSGASAGQLYSGIQGLAANRMRNDASAWTQKNNMENQLSADQANMMMGVGSQRADMNFNVANINQQSDAARRAMLGQGFSDLSEYAQMQQLMGNQQNRDKDLAGLYPDMFGSVYPYMSGAQNVINKYKQG